MPLVFKLGGEALLAPTTLHAFLQSVKLLMSQRAVVIVHGGGPQADAMLSAAGISTNKTQGVRSTPTEHLPLVVGALAGVASQQLLAATKKADINALALSLADSDSFECKTKDPSLGAVGTVSPKCAKSLMALLASGHLIVMSSIGCDATGQSLNINADEAALAVAKLLDAELILLSNVSGVLDAKQQVLPQLNKQDINNLIELGVISDGMVVKVNAAWQAAQYLRRPVTIGSWHDTHAMQQLPLNSQLQLGTQIQP